MDNRYHGNLEVSSAPHLVSPVNTAKIMGMVLIALAPALEWGYISSDTELQCSHLYVWRHVYYLSI